MEYCQETQDTSCKAYAFTNKELIRGCIHQVLLYYTTLARLPRTKVIRIISLIDNYVEHSRAKSNEPMEYPKNGMSGLRNPDAGRILTDKEVLLRSVP